MVIPRFVLLLAAMLFLGYFILWCVVPTVFWWYGWFVFLSIKTDTKYFGLQGTFMLIFTVPVLVIAVLGCLYLHLMKNGRPINSDKSVKRSDRVAAILRQPMLVRGPLGVVSATELVFLLLFITLLIWSIAYMDTHNPIVQNMNPRQTRRHVNDTIWQKKLRSTGFYMATTGNLCSALLFYPVTRGSSILPLLGLTSDGSIKYHMWIGNLAIFLFTAHGMTFILYWALTHDLVEMLKWDMHSVANVPGELAALLGIALWVTVHPRIRRKLFELFFYTHHLYIPFMFFYMLHTGFSFFCMILPGFYLFLVDRYLRFLQSRRKVRLLSARILPCQTVELNFSKSPTLHYSPTSFVSINVPSISSMQWHPFSVSSNCSLEPDVLSVIVKKNGNWSQKLYETVASLSPVDRLEVAIEGPHGRPSSADFLRYKTLVMVAGGSGISPIASIIRELIFRKQQANYIGGCSTPRVVLICAFKHSEDLTMLNLILPDSRRRGGSSSFAGDGVSQLEIHIEAFVTRDDHHHHHEAAPVVVLHEDVTNYMKAAANNYMMNHAAVLMMIKTIWFRPHPGDEPLYPTLGGPHHWFWLGAIISSSFAMFLVITGLLGRYYIYPASDKKSNIIRDTQVYYSWTARTCLNALSLCVSIFTTATAAVLWNKRRYAKLLEAAGTKVQSLELLANPTININASPDHIARLREADNQELESGPISTGDEQSTNIIPKTRVHYGSRPNLKKMLLEYDGPSSTGVLVCGPAPMRQQVAQICASGLAENLHYESISFSF